MFGKSPFKRTLVGSFTRSALALSAFASSPTGGETFSSGATMGRRISLRSNRSGNHLRQQLAVVRADNVRGGERRVGDRWGVALSLPTNASFMCLQQPAGRSAGTEKLFEGVKRCLSRDKIIFMRHCQKLPMHNRVLSRSVDFHVLRRSPPPP